MREGFDFEAALAAYLQSWKPANRRNGTARKAIKSTTGSYKRLLSRLIFSKCTDPTVYVLLAEYAREGTQ